MIMRLRARSLFTLFIVCLSGYAVISARNWLFGTRLFPWVIGIPVFVLSLIQLAIEIHQSMNPSKMRAEETGDLQVDLSISSGEVARKAGNFFAWLLGFFFAIWFFGFFVAVPLYGFLNLKFQAKEGWLLSLALTLAGFVFFVGLFDQVLHLPWHIPVFPGPEHFIRSVIPNFV
jgi:hypothetical protein